MKKSISIAIISILSLSIFAACGERNYPGPRSSIPKTVVSAEVPLSLVSGTPPYADPDPLVYIGNVSLKGWIVQVPFYTGEPEDHFHIAEESLSKLPQEIIDSGRRDFKLKDVGDSDIEKLKTYGKENPAEITVSKLTLNMEGNPILNFIGIVK